jgi:ABC-2 type transport system permease protein
MFAIVEREMRKFFRSPMLMIMSLMMPILQLLIMGNAFGGKIVGARVAVVDYDHGPEAVKIREGFDAIAVNIKTFTTVNYTDENLAREDVRTGKVDGAVIIPKQYSRRVYAQDAPQIGFVVDNSDQFTSGSLESEMQSLVTALTNPVIQPRLANSIALDIVELYPYVNYMKFLLPACIALAMYISVMIGGGMLYIDDKARGVHEGYLVTPITKLELVFGLNMASAIKATLSGICLTVIGSLMAGLGIIFHPWILLQLLALILGTSIAFNGMMFLLMVRVEDPLTPRAMFGVLNLLLFYPSGAMYPISSFPWWLRSLSVIDPFTYCVHGFKAIILKDGGFQAIQFDLLFLFVFGFACLLVATPLFKRTL